jgi:hypothetical protein
MFYVLWTVNTSYTTHSRDALNRGKNGRTRVLVLTSSAPSFAGAAVAAEAVGALDATGA